jgi:1-acyl-sn-glycerol-3-phosphate acyltransferase
MLRNSLFLFFFFFGIIFISIIFLPSLFLPQKITLFGGKLMGYWSKICLKIFLSTEIIIKGREKIITDKKYFIACSHQSMFETFFLQTIFNSPVFILKKELTKIPIFGWYLLKIGSISIDRNKIKKENLDFLSNVKLVVNSSNRPLVIFPQATRMNFNDRSPFKKGVSRIYDELKIICLPIAINSGVVWPKTGKLVSNKKIIVSILDPIMPGKDQKAFLNFLQDKIYNELDNISKPS